MEYCTISTCANYLGRFIICLTIRFKFCHQNLSVVPFSYWHCHILLVIFVVHSFSIQRLCWRFRNLNSQTIISCPTAYYIIQKSDLILLLNRLLVILILKFNTDSTGIDCKHRRAKYIMNCRCPHQLQIIQSKIHCAYFS